ncbi:huntingtin [Achroia grisella]|uniref:huntingtin n=1 Tax=Achroia grisella TaxID=688607 RepID=UPI0027D31F41|nr:huntingtin [Achroia grisella]
MNLLEKAEKALEYLKTNDGSTKSHELQTAAGTLGRCLGALGSRPNFAKHYANLLHTAIPTLLSLASNDNAEVRLVGDEALNRAVVGGLAFHSHKTNTILQNYIDITRNARWIRSALTRICLGDSWLRPGTGKIRSQAQTLIPKLSLIVRQTSEIQLIVEALENNLPRILTALAEYTTDEEISDLAKALLSHVESTEPAVRRGVSSCVAHLCSHKELLLPNILGKVFEKLWPISSESTVIMGWFCVVKAIFQINDISKFNENELFTVQDYLELYQLCVHYIEQCSEHNTQNTVMECLTVLLSHATGDFRKALLDKRPHFVCLDDRQTDKRHKRNISSASVVSTRYVPSPSSEHLNTLELSFTGELQLGSALQLNTPSLSVEDLSIQTPESPTSEPDVQMQNTEELSKEISEKLQEYEESEDKDYDQVDQPQEHGFKVNIGSSTDEDIPLKYCARLLASKYLLTGNKGELIHDRTVRVSVKASALSCLSEILHLYPQVVTMYLDKDADMKNHQHNISGSSEGTDMHQEHINDFILERNVCYQDSSSDSMSQDFLNRSTDSQQTSNSQQIYKKDSKSLEKSIDSEQKSSTKDVPSAILDSKYGKSDMGMSIDSTNPNMTNSNFTTNSNLTGSTWYPMSSSGDVLSSSVDLDMKFDHFGESPTNLDNLDALKDLEKKEDRPKRPLRRTFAKVAKEDDKGLKVEEIVEKDFIFQHMSDVFVLLEGHNDPQIRGLVRVCIGKYLSAALELSHGDYHRWRNFIVLPKDVSNNISTEKLVGIVLKGLTDDIHSTVNHTLSALTNMAAALCASIHWSLMIDALNSLITVESNGYWLCRVNLCKLYEKLPYQRLYILYSGYHVRSKTIMDTLMRLLADQDQKVRKAAAHSIVEIIPKIYPPKRSTPITMVTDMAKEHSQKFIFDKNKLSLDLVRDMYFYSDLPDQLRCGDVITNEDSLRIVIADLLARTLSSSCKFYTQGLLETLQAICKRWSPWKHIDAYTEQGILSYCLDSLDYCNGTVVVRTVLLDLCALVYPVEIHNLMKHKTSNRDIFERDSSNARQRWQHLESEKVGNLAEKFLQVTLKMLNVLVHLIEEVNPNVHLNKGGIALPGSPVRRKTQDSTPRKASNASEVTDDKGSLRKKVPVPATSLKANFAGHFYTEPFYMRFYETLRATYSNHKINLDPRNSMFHDFLSTVLNTLAIQLELATEKEFGPVTEEILYYLKVLMPLRPDTTVYCVTQLLKCLFGTNMISQYSDFMSINDKNEAKDKNSFFHDVMLINSLNTDKGSRRSSGSSNASQKLALDSKNPRMMEERQLLIAMENFSKNKMDRKWSTNKKELERYIRLFEPVVIQALKSYTMQNDIPLQSKVLCLLNQLLTLRVNYCMLDNDQVFIGFLMKQLDLVEQHEIPNCCDLVYNILLFLVQLSSSKHHTKQIIEIPKLIQLCDGLMASGAHLECIAGLEPVAVKVFSSMGSTSVLGRTQQQEAQATREVLFYMLQKTMHQHKVLDLVSCVLSLSQEHPESYYRWSELATDTLLNLLTQRTIEIDSAEAISSLERLLDSIYKDVLLEPSRVEVLMKILFKAPPDQLTTPTKSKLRYLSIIMVLLRKVLILIPESEILLTINYLKASSLSPQSIFFNVKPDVDPLNVQNVNENCANLSPDVVLVRLLFKTLTYVIIEMDGCYDGCDGAISDLQKTGNKVENDRLLYSVCVNIIVQVKHMLHLTNGCLFPLTAKTAQTILHNEQSGLNTGLYSPDENIPLDLLNLICLRSAHRIPLLTVHWSHLLIRLNFLTHKFWQKLIGFARNLPLRADSADKQLLRVDILQIACVMAYCEYFVDNGLSEVVHLTWLLVNRGHILISQYQESVVHSLITKVQQTDSASGLFLQAVAARCQNFLKDEFALNAYKILSLCHESQSGALIFFICRIIGKQEPALAVRFAKLAIDRCWMLKEMNEEKINEQLSKEDVQIALEMLQRDQAHVRYPSLVMELNSLASTFFALSPLDLSQDRAINPQYISTTSVDANWLANLVKSRCCQKDPTTRKLTNQNELALLMWNLSEEELTTVTSCPEFDRKILSPCFKISTDNYIREFLNVVSVHESKEIEKDRMKEHREAMKIKEDVTTSIDSNKLNVANTLHVFKKSDSKESKSQFFIPIRDNENAKENFGHLELTEEETELILPELSGLYRAAVATFDKCLTDVIRLFPKQNRPLSQSENFNLNVEQSIDRYTRRCHQVFQDKLFYQEYITLHTILTGYLDALRRLIGTIDEIDCDLLDKSIDNILPGSLAKNIAIFSVMSLQYLSFLIKNKQIVESPINNDVSFRTPDVTENIVIDNVILITVDNVAKALSFQEVWTELNMSNMNKTQSTISCLYAVVKYLVKDSKPLVLNHYIQTQDTGPTSDMIVIGNKLVTLIGYWEQNFYTKPSSVMGKCYVKHIERLLVSLSRLDIVSNIALIPPIAWSSVEVSSKKELPLKIDLPLQALQDMDILEAFLFRVNLIGWSSKKQFEEIWVGLLGALQGNGTHWAIRGITELLISTIPKVRTKGILHVPRSRVHVSNGMQILRNIVAGTSAYKLFECVNLERIPLQSDGLEGYHYPQFNAEYLKLASDIVDGGSYKVRQEMKRIKKNREVDVNSCLQILMDVTTQMLDPKAGAGAAARVVLVAGVPHAGAAFSEAGQWCWAGGVLLWLAADPHAALTQYSAAARALLLALSTCLCVLDGVEGLQELSTVHQKLLKSLTSSYAPLRQAALQGCLLQLSSKPAVAPPGVPNPFQELVTKLNVVVVRHYLLPNNEISLYEQSLYWTVLFALVELGHPDLINLAVDFVLKHPRHYCADLVVKGICTTIRQQVLPKDLKNTIIEKLLDNMENYCEHHAVQVLMVHLFSADNKLLSPKLTSDVSNMDPDVLMSSMERITLLYKSLRQVKNKESKTLITSAMKYFLRETLPPAATLSRVVIEFLESCKDAERVKLGVISDRERWIESAVLNAQIVFEVFETAVSQDQLPVLSGWIFEALCHLLNEKVSATLLPYCVTTLLVSASSNQFIRKVSPLCYSLLRSGFHKAVDKEIAWGIFRNFLTNSEDTVSFTDRRLMCVVSTHSDFTAPQLERLKELCDKNQCLEDVLHCLNL